MDSIVKNRMALASGYATVPVGTTPFEALPALEESQLNFDRSEHLRRGLILYRPPPARLNKSTARTISVMPT